MASSTPGLDILRHAKAPIYNRPPSVFGRQILACRRLLQETTPEFFEGRWMALLALQIRAAYGDDRAIRFEFGSEDEGYVFAMRTIAVVNRAQLLTLPDAIAAIGVGRGRATAEDNINLTVGELRRFIRRQEVEEHETLIGELLAPLAYVIRKNTTEGQASMICAGLADAILRAMKSTGMALQFVIERPVFMSKERGSMEFPDLFGRLGRIAEAKSIVDRLLDD